MNGRLAETGRLLRLKDQRLDSARLAHALALRAVRQAEEQLTRRDAAIAALDQRRTRLDGWFAEPPSDPRLIEAALACRALVAEQRDAEAQARLADVTALETAEARRAETAREVARAQARRDAAEQVLARLKLALSQHRERRVEQELEERLYGAGALA